MEDKEWSCRNQCKSNCCSEIFFPLDKINKVFWKKKKCLFLPKNKTDYDFLKLHDSVIIDKSMKRVYKIEIKKGYETKIKHNDIEDRDYLWVNSKCSKLLDNNKCGIYRNRPMICKISKCPVFETDKKVLWFGMNGNLKIVSQTFK